jgi:zinc and cadmium transporter
MGDLGVLVHAGLTPRRALLFNFLTALTAVAGAIITLVLEDTIGGVVRPMLALSAGAFIYIAGSDLIPELHKDSQLRVSILQFVGVAAGFGVMAALLSLE